MSVRSGEVVCRAAMPRVRRRRDLRRVAVDVAEGVRGRAEVGEVGEG